MKFFIKLAQIVFVTQLFTLSLDCLAQNRDQIKYKCAVEAGPIQDWKTREKVYDQCLSLKGFVRDADLQSLFDQPIITKTEKLRKQQKAEKESEEYYQATKKKEGECDKKMGRKCNITMASGETVTDHEGYLYSGKAHFFHSFKRQLSEDYEWDIRRDTLCAIPLRPGIDYDKDLIWYLRRYCGKTSNQESSSKPSNQTPAPSAPPPQQITKLDILKKNSQFIFECIVVAQIFSTAADAQNADADLKKITKSLSDRYSGYGDQILTVTDELKSRAERMTQQFSNLDKDTQVGQWQRCNQWQP
jgi:hypothetical protein